MTEYLVTDVSLMIEKYYIVYVDKIIIYHVQIKYLI